MQTFLPYPGFRESAATLDNRRLGKQRVEAFQILKTLRTGRKAWSNHPAVKMWREHEDALVLYMDAMIKEWIHRGFKNTMVIEPVGDVLYPQWLGKETFHSAHRAALLAKAPEHYGAFGWSEVPEIRYEWPI
jgi:hypothetical protein